MYFPARDTTLVIPSSKPEGFLVPITLVKKGVPLNFHLPSGCQSNKALYRRATQFLHARRYFEPASAVGTRSR